MEKSILESAIMTTLQQYATNDFNGVSLIAETDFADVLHDIMVDINKFLEESK